METRDSRPAVGVVTVRVMWECGGPAAGVTLALIPPRAPDDGSGARAVRVLRTDERGGSPAVGRAGREGLSLRAPTTGPRSALSSARSVRDLCWPSTELRTAVHR